MQSANVRWGTGYYDGVTSGIMVWRREHYAFFLWKDRLGGLRHNDLLWQPERVYVVVELSRFELECAVVSQAIATSAARDNNRYDWEPNHRIKGVTFPECVGKLKDEDYFELTHGLNEVVRKTETKPKIGWFRR